MKRRNLMGLMVGAMTMPVAASAMALLPGRLEQADAAAVIPAQVNMVIVSGIRLGPDKKLHDAYTPTTITARAGQKVVVTVYNYDTGEHSFTAPALHLNVIFPAAARTGDRTVTTFSFTVNKAGSYPWHCAMSCDTEAGGWSMAHAGYMAGTVTIVEA